MPRAPRYSWSVRPAFAALMQLRTERTRHVATRGGYWIWLEYSDGTAREDRPAQVSRDGRLGRPVSWELLRAACRVLWATGP